MPYVSTPVISLLLPTVPWLVKRGGYIYSGFVQAVEGLGLLLRPAGGGIHLVSTGRAEQVAFQRAWYGVHDEPEVEARFGEALQQIVRARVVLLGIPSDVGAGYRRGANLGPQAIRGALMVREPGWRKRMAGQGIVDVGDVRVVPQLLSDDMLNATQKRTCQKALYPDVSAGVRRGLPVSPLSIAERALMVIKSINRKVVLVVLGGDHSTAWPVASVLAAQHHQHWAIVQIDAHTDLLAERLGIRMCFGTWAYHANELLGRGGRLVQVGIRASRYDQAYWERTLGVRQFWAQQCREYPEKTLKEVVGHLNDRGIKQIYFSNDIDGTDEKWAGATGTPEPDGLDPQFVGQLIRILGKNFELIGGDMVEVAPTILPMREGGQQTAEVAAGYVEEMLGAIRK